MKPERKQIGPLFQERKFKELMALYRLEPSWFNNVAMRTFFSSAVRRGDFEALQFILDIGYDINEVSYTGTPLSRAANDGTVEIVQWLIDHGARPDESSLSTNPLFSAIQGGKPELVRYFLTLGISTERRYPCGRNALDFARTWNNPDVIAELGGDPEWKRPPWVLCSIPDLSGQKPSPEMLNAVENELKFTVPEPLKYFLLNNLPDQLFFKDAKDNDEWVWLGKDHHLFHTARSLIAYNCIDPGAKEKSRIYKKYIVVGTDGFGNDYCLSTVPNDDRVWIHDHETDEFESTNLSLLDFSARLISELEESP